ncbi:response regulator transcription factor [Campylobacter canadensis]|uniref:Response regulator transcription factor n=1 Tax=Campylobacter canadensis TaxID=449520 RepID=A0ABS7WQG3_9BACT|nr:response regulator transcription factor [Campylobacter canadensis]MBZ7986616.1 response regulator transcription factor [Campylobacter canadensis]MBZ7993979.1 response regulator transcription factor [Campylobacter canadensis]MBZ7996295.1 response regulator transcription factor [Campylobacter canadensis]MBZ7997652.1 response regulator transcription factor [Campylobacter canadensis]MBZ7999311.1 response regulator transcription factor [Campylobacter canadensis]
MQIALLIDNKQDKFYIKELLESEFECIEVANSNVVLAKNINIVISDMYDEIEFLSKNSVKFIAISKNPNFNQAQQCLKAGAKAYANSKMQKNHFVDAIRCVNNGGIWLLPEIVLNMIKLINVNYEDNSTVLESLNDRERQIVKYIKDGLNNNAIAQNLNLSLRTIKSDSASIYQKLGVENKIALMIKLKNISL